MDDTYDCIVLGTGLKECILSGLLSVDGLKVLHLDRNGYYGGASASLNLNQLYEQFKPSDKPDVAKLGQSREYNVDVVPKFIMASGLLVQMLLHTDVTRYLEFKSIAGSYVYKGGKIYKVPATDTEALKMLTMLGIMETRRFKKFMEYIQDYDEKNTATHNGHDLTKMTMKELYAKFGLETDTIEFIGHAIALYHNDAYLTVPAIESVRKIRLYFESLARYSKSPYIYPLYGLGELPQGFARLSAIYGGTYMLNAPIKDFVYSDSGVITGVRSTDGTSVAKCKFVVGDPSYFPSKVKKTGQVIRVICLMSHPLKDTDNSESCQLIIPQKQLNRTSDVYVCVVSSANNVAPKGKYVAIVATTVETANPLNEVAPALKLLEPIDQQFVTTSDVFLPLEDGTKDKVFISQSFDASTHFESTVEDVIAMYQRITGKPLVLKPKEQEGSSTTATSPTAK